MRHRKVRSRLGRTTEHRKALMRNLANALLEHERIETTQAKATQLRCFVEPLITLARTGDLHSRRQAFSHLQQKEVVHKLFTEIGPRVGDRPGGYTRVVKMGVRQGDGAPMAIIELVDSKAVAAEGAGEGGVSKSIKRKMHERRKEMQKMRRR